MNVREHYEDYWNQDDPSPLSDPLAQTRLGLLAELLTSSDREILDVGCGHGVTLAGLQRSGAELAGFDISERALDLARQRCSAARFTRHSVEDLPWPITVESKDVVIAFEVIEHLLHPTALIAGAHQVLREGGHFALTTPYHGRIKNVAISLVAFDRHFSQDGDHIRFFSDAALRRFFESGGFEVERMIHFGRLYPLSAGVFVWAKKR